MLGNRNILIENGFVVLGLSLGFHRDTMRTSTELRPKF
jgi:hypothetical protein